MSQIQGSGGIHSQFEPLNVQQDRQQGNVPEGLQNAHSGQGVCHIIGRVVGGVLTLGISECIRAIVNCVRSASPEETPQARLNDHAQASRSESSLGPLSSDDAARVRAALAPRPSPGEGASRRIETHADLVAFIGDMAFGQPGSSKPVGQATASDGKTSATLHHYSGLVFRSDQRSSGEILSQGGMHSRQLLSNPANMLEAQGLAFNTGRGATGQSGVSMAKDLAGAIPYYTSGGIYIIDTRQFDGGQYAYDLQAIMDSTNPNCSVPTGGEVNATDVPKKAIVGWISLPTPQLNNVSNTSNNDLKIGKLLNYIPEHPDYVHLNSDDHPVSSQQGA